MSAIFLIILRGALVFTNEDLYTESSFYEGKSRSKLQMDIELKQQEYWFEKYIYF
jgi:hypothetical protein